MAARLMRFGVVSEQARKTARLERSTAVASLLVFGWLHISTKSNTTGSKVKTISWPKHYCYLCGQNNSYFWQSVGIVPWIYYCKQLSCLLQQTWC